MRDNQLFAYGKTKTQISFAVTAELISVFVFTTQIVQSLYFLNLEFQASRSSCVFCGCTARFVSDLVGNPEDRFSHNKAQIISKLCSLKKSTVMIPSSSDRQIGQFLLHLFKLLLSHSKFLGVPKFRHFMSDQMRNVTNMGYQYHTPL